MCLHVVVYRVHVQDKILETLHEKVLRFAQCNCIILWAWWHLALYVHLTACWPSSLENPKETGIQCLNCSCMTKQQTCPLVTSQSVLSPGCHEEKASLALFCPSQAKPGITALPVVFIFCTPVVQSSSLSQFLSFLLKRPLQTRTYSNLVIYCVWWDWWREST